MRKKIHLTFLCAMIIFLACKKEAKEKTENACPVISAAEVPSVVKDSFSIRYPSMNVITWFNKDSVAFCAYFVSGSMDKLAQFAINGSFIKEEVEIFQEGQHDEDSTGTSVNGKTSTPGCECEIHKSHD